MLDWRSDGGGSSELPGSKGERRSQRQHGVDLPEANERLEAFGTVMPIILTWQLQGVLMWKGVVVYPVQESSPRRAAAWRLCGRKTLFVECLTKTYLWQFSGQFCNFLGEQEQKFVITWHGHQSETISRRYTGLVCGRFQDLKDVISLFDDTNFFCRASHLCHRRLTEKYLFF